MTESKTMKRAHFLKGKKAGLRPLSPEDYSAITQWLNDPLVTHYLFYGQKPWTIQQVSEEFARQSLAPNNAVFMVDQLDGGRSVGFAGLYDIHPTAHKAEFRVLLGERSIWNKGIGTEITELLTYYGFDRLNLHRVFLGVTSENKGAVRAYENAGYVQEGCSRDDIYRNSRYYDTVRMGILREEYYRGLHAKHAKHFSLQPTAGAERGK
jgi:RimJ/RimL family protein N-acetyltransferase